MHEQLSAIRPSSLSIKPFELVLVDDKLLDDTYASL